MVIHIYGITRNTAKSVDQYYSSYSYQSSSLISYFPVHLWLAFVPGPSLRILDSIRCQRTPLCHILLLNLDILQGSFRLCNWLSLRRLVSWINHLPPACWSTFRKSNSKQQLGCRFDIMDYESYFFVFWHMQLYMSWYIISFFGFTFLNILIFSSTLVLTSSYRRNLYTFYHV